MTTKNKTRRFITSLLASCAVCGVAANAFAQAAIVQGSAATSRTHLERFSSADAQAATIEREAESRLTKNPNDAAALNSRALARMRLNRYAEALQDLQLATRLQPTNAEYLANYGFALWKLGRTDEAITAGRAAYAANKETFTSNYQLGRFLLARGDKASVAEAVKLLQRALEIDPRRYEIRFDLVSAFRALGDKAQLNAQLNLLNQARPTDARVAYTEALAATDRNDLNDAVLLLRRALERDPAFALAQRDLGIAYIKLGKWTEAAAAFSAFVKLEPDSPEAAYFYALSLYNSGDSQAAERETRRALRINAGAAEAYTLLGIVLAAKGNTNSNAEAAEALEQAIELDANSFDANFYLGRVRYAMQSYAAAVGNLRRAVTLNEQHAEARFFLGTALEKAGDADAAAIEYERLVALDPNSTLGLTGRGVLLLKRGETTEAIKTLEQATRLDARNFEARFALGRALILAEKFAQSIDVLQQAVKLIPERADARYQLGLALRRAGRAAEAAREFETVNRLNAEFRARAVGM